MSKSQDKTIFLELGQVIQLNASQNINFHEKNFIIDYLDEEKIELVQEDDLSRVVLTIQDGNITEESIESIFILSNAIEKGYARQNDLVPDTWISIHFDGNEPMIVNGLITDIEEDMIEITTHPAKDVIYLDFEYKGIPKNLNIVSINIINEPGKESLEEEPIEVKTDVLDDEDLDRDLDDDLELNLELDLDTEEQQKNIDELFIDLEDIEIIEDDIGEITEQVYVSEKEKRYSIDTQVNDLLDELLALVPTNKRTQEVLNKIHISIERFKQLRENFSNFDIEGNAESILKKGANHKPLINSIIDLKKKLMWILPVIKTKKNIYEKENIMEDYDDNINMLPVDFALNGEFEIIYQYDRNEVPDGQNKYEFLYKNLNQYMIPHVEPTELTNVITKKKVNDEYDVLIDNEGDFYSSTMSSSSELVYNSSISLNSNRFVMQRINTGLTHLVNPDISNKKSILYLDNLTPNDNIYIKGFVTLPYNFIKYSSISLPTTSIYNKSNLNLINFSYSNFLNESTIYKKTTIAENKEEEKDNFNLNKLQYFDFEEIRKFEDRVEDDNIFKSYLNNIIPKIKTIFNNYKNNIVSGVSFDRVVKQLEPFLIYKDDITFKQYHLIMDFVNNEINKVKNK